VERAEVLGVVQDKAHELLGVEPSDVREERSFQDDLEVDSLDLVEFTMAIEDACDVQLPEDELDNCAKIGDLVSLVVRKQGAAA
jgi:acyl carrier protein